MVALAFLKNLLFGTATIGITGSGMLYYKYDFLTPYRNTENWMSTTPPKGSSN